MADPVAPPLDEDNIILDEDDDQDEDEDVPASPPRAPAPASRDDSVAGHLMLAVVALCGSTALVIAYLAFFADSLPLVGPSVEEQINDLRTMITHHDEILVLGMPTGEFTVDAASGDTVDVRNPNLQEQVADAQLGIAELDTSLGEVKSTADDGWNIANEANGRSVENADGIAELGTSVRRVGGAQAALAKKMDATTASVATLARADSTFNVRLNTAQQDANAASRTAQRANDKADTLQIQVSAHDQRLNGLEAVNVFLFTGKDSLLTVALGNGSVAPELVAGLEAGQRAVEKYRRK